MNACMPIALSTEGPPTLDQASPTIYLFMDVQSPQ